MRLQLLPREEDGLAPAVCSSCQGILNICPKQGFSSLPLAPRSLLLRASPGLGCFRTICRLHNITTDVYLPAFFHTLQLNLAEEKKQ